MNLALLIFMFLWIGLPIIFIVAAVILFFVDRSAKKQMEAEIAMTGKNKFRVSQIFFIVFLTLAIVSSSLSIGLFILLDQIVRTM